MSLSYYMDQHVPRQISEGLRRRGVDILTAYEDGRSDTADEELLARAAELGRILFSQDRDFLIISNQWKQTGKEFAGVIYAHQLSITIGQAVRDLEFMSDALEPEDMLNKVEFIPL